MADHDLKLDLYAPEEQRAEEVLELADDEEGMYEKRLLLGAHCLKFQDHLALMRKDLLELDDNEDAIAIHEELKGITSCMDMFEVGLDDSVMNEPTGINLADWANLCLFRLAIVRRRVSAFKIYIDKTGSAEALLKIEAFLFCVFEFLNTGELDEYEIEMIEEEPFFDVSFLLEQSSMSDPLNPGRTLPRGASRFGEEAKAIRAAKEAAVAAAAAEEAAAEAKKAEEAKRVEEEAEAARLAAEEAAEEEKRETEQVEAGEAVPEVREDASGEDEPEGDVPEDSTPKESSQEEEPIAEVVEEDNSPKEEPAAAEEEPAEEVEAPLEETVEPEATGSEDVEPTVAEPAPLKASAIPWKLKEDLKASPAKTRRRSIVGAVFNRITRASEAPESPGRFRVRETTSTPSPQVLRRRGSAGESGASLTALNFTSVPSMVAPLLRGRLSYLTSSGILGRWKRRWGILNMEKLELYKDNACLNLSKAYEVTRICQVAANQKKGDKEFSFVVEIAGGELVQLAVASSVELLQWIIGLAKVADKASEGEQSVVPAVDSLVQELASKFSSSATLQRGDEEWTLADGELRLTGSNICYSWDGLQFSHVAGADLGQASWDGLTFALKQEGKEDFQCLWFECMREFKSAAVNEEGDNRAVWGWRVDRFRQLRFAGSTPEVNKKLWAISAPLPPPVTMAVACFSNAYHGIELLGAAEEPGTREGAHKRTERRKRRKSSKRKKEKLKAAPADSKDGQ